MLAWLPPKRKEDAELMLHRDKVDIQVEVTDGFSSFWSWKFGLAHPSELQEDFQYGFHPTSQ